MGDENVDPCECIWSHELAMRRLLSFLRQGQAYCTNSECIDEMPRLNESSQAADNFILMSVILLFTVILYTMRPRRNNRSVEDKGGPSQGGGSLPPPPPPPTAPTN